MLEEALIVRPMSLEMFSRALVVRMQHGVPYAPVASSPKTPMQGCKRWVDTVFNPSQFNQISYNVKLRALSMEV